MLREHSARKRRSRSAVSLVLAGLSCALTAGCAALRSVDAPPAAPSGFAWEADGDYYDQVARNLDFADVASAEFRPGSVESVPEGFDSSPRILRALSEDDVWRMTLAEAIHFALEQNTIILSDNQFLASGSLLFGSPENVPSVFDPALQQSALQGQRGVAAAESDFIPVLSAQRISGQDETIQNNLFSGGIVPGQVLDEQFDRFSLLVSKQTKLGGQVSVRHDVNFDKNNVPSRLFGSAYDTQLAFDINQPLWAGAGEDFTDIAGPIGFISQRTPSVDQGIRVASLNETLSQVQFENALQQLVRDVTEVYWDLAFAHRQFEIESRTRDESERVWSRARAKLQAGLGEGAADEAQAAESFYAARARAEEALAQVALTENRLRRLLGIPGNDQQVIRPFDEPTTAPVDAPWHELLFTAYSARNELHQTKITIRSLEFQLQAAHSYAHPRLDFVGNFHLNGFGDRLFSSSPQVTAVNDSAYQNLGNANQIGWSAGVVFSTPLDRRAQRTLVRQLELRLAKTRAALAAQEWEITRELTHALRSAERWRQLLGTNSERVEAARRQVRALEAAFPSGRVSIDLLVRAQTTLAQAETEHARNLIEYNKALAELKFRQGTLLEAHRVSVLEMPVPMPAP